MCFRQMFSFFFVRVIFSFNLNDLKDQLSGAFFLSVLQLFNEYMLMLEFFGNLSLFSLLHLPLHVIIFVISSLNLSSTFPVTDTGGLCFINNLQCAQALLFQARST